MSLYRDEGVVLRTSKLGEADRIITILTRGHGKIRAVAKGVRRTKSRFGARLEPFMRVDVLIAEGRSLDVVSQAEAVAAYGAPIAADYAAYEAANVIVETIDKIATDNPSRKSNFIDCHHIGDRTTYRFDYHIRTGTSGQFHQAGMHIFCLRIDAVSRSKPGGQSQFLVIYIHSYHISTPQSRSYHSPQTNHTASDHHYRVVIGYLCTRYRMETDTHRFDQRTITG